MASAMTPSRISLPTACPSLLALVALGATASPALAQCPEEPLVQHWTGAGTTISAGFIAGEEWGAVFNTQIPANHYPIEILRVGFGWGSVFGGSPQTLEDSLNIYPAGLPNPGGPQFSLGAPVLTDGFINEFDLEPIPNGPGLDRIIDQGPFTVTIRLFNDTPQIFGPAPSHDGNGCQPGKNVIKCVPPGLCSGWVDACSVGSTGDWQVHVVYRRVDCSNGPGLTYCVGTGGGVSGCTPCPCGNNAFPGSEGGCLNSNFRSGEILATGTASVSNDTMHFDAKGLTSNSFAVLVSGDNQLPAMGPCPPGSGVQSATLDGLRCTGGGLLRHGSRASDAMGMIGMTTNGWGPPNAPVGGIIAASGFVSGQTRHFQIFYRETATAGCMTGQNTSNAVTITFGM